MSDISRNIKKLRLDAHMTQDTLAEKLNVTRQTVSNYEQNKTQPDLAMLKSIADVFSTDEMGVIYGKCVTAAYPQNKRERIHTTVGFGIFVMLLFAIKIFFFQSEYIEYCYHRYIMWPVYLSQLLIIPALCVATGFFLLNLLSVWKDIRIKNSTLRRGFLIGAVSCAALYYIALFLLMLIQVPLALTLFQNPMPVFAVVGVTAFLGCNRA